MTNEEFCEKAAKTYHPLDSDPEFIKAHQYARDMLDKAILSVVFAETPLLRLYRRDSNAG